MKAGDSIIYVDEHGKKRPSLITIVGIPSDPERTWLNVAFVNLDEGQTDGYGQKLERRSSVPAWSEGWTGNYWTKE